MSRSNSKSYSQEIKLPEKFGLGRSLESLASEYPHFELCLQKVDTNEVELDKSLRDIYYSKLNRFKHPENRESSFELYNEDFTNITDIREGTNSRLVEKYNMRLTIPAPRKKNGSVVNRHGNKKVVYRIPTPWFQSSKESTGVKSKRSTVRPPTPFPMSPITCHKNTDTSNFEFSFDQSSMHALIKNIIDQESPRTLSYSDSNIYESTSVYSQS